MSELKELINVTFRVAAIVCVAALLVGVAAVAVWWHIGNVFMIFMSCVMVVFISLMGACLVGLYRVYRS